MRQSNTLFVYFQHKKTKTKQSYGDSEQRGMGRFHDIAKNNAKITKSVIHQRPDSGLKLYGCMVKENRRPL